MQHAPESTLHAITNFLQINPKLGTAGQPARNQFPAIKAAGYEVVINLVPPVSAEMLPDEGEIAAGLGLEYIHIPVIWERPTRDDLLAFFAALQIHQNRKIFVHCVMNMRVSAFVFLYRVLALREPTAPARMMMSRIWEPNPTWQHFIDEQIKFC